MNTAYLHSAPLESGWAVRLDARAKLLGVLALLIALVTTPPEAPFVFPGFLFLALGLFLTARVPLLPALRRTLVVLPLVATVALTAPFLETPNATLFVWSVFHKAFAGIACTLWLTSVTSLPRILDALARLRLPGILVQLAGFVYRYLFIIADEVVRMKRGLDARGFRGSWFGRLRILGHVAGTLFLRSYERAERTHGAMLARGYDGHAPSRPAESLRGQDYLFLSAMAILALSVRGGLQ